MTFLGVEAVSEYEQERGKPMPSFNHGVVQANLVFLFKLNYGETHRTLSEVTLATEPTTTPDVAVYEKRDPNWAHDEVQVVEPPLMVIEILSTTQSLNELVDKTQLYFTAGVKSCWLVLPTHKLVAVHTPNSDPKVFTEGTVNDPASKLSVTIEDIFQ